MANKPPQQIAVTAESLMILSTPDGTINWFKSRSDHIKQINIHGGSMYNIQKMNKAYQSYILAQTVYSILHALSDFIDVLTNTSVYKDMYNQFKQSVTDIITNPAIKNGSNKQVMDITALGLKALQEL